MRQQVISDEKLAGAPPPASSMQIRSTSAASAGKRSEFGEVEKVFPNGDIYSGGFAGNAPEGYGKCTWIDGSVYEGEWREGNAAGEGKFRWPSGASYEGEFKEGRMEGYGTFTGADGETYQGSWISDQKHGYGKKSYANGDFYEGQWKRDVQEGQGRYVWRDGIQYFGEWRNGMICGRGVLILANGELCDGQWENGVAKKSGGFAWPDWSCNFGNRSRDVRSQLNGVSYSVSLSINDESAVDGVFARSRKAEEDLGFGEGEAACRESRQSDCCLVTDGVKKPWPIISKGHKSYDLVYKLQLGIRYSVGITLSKKQVKLWPSDFNPGEKYWTTFPPEGSNSTRPHNSSEFRWKDYCPNVFRHLRKLFGVDPADYIKAICGTDFLRELPSPGKSGSLLFLTQDDRFIIKTVRKSEVKMLIRMLLNYHQHVRQYENSLITKFYGVHCVKPIGGHKVRFIVMGNVLCSEHGIHRRFDLKGSSHGRTVYKSEKVVDQTSTLKDLDLNFVFHLQKPWFKNFMWQIERDCEFLEGEGIMDYSLLVGVHFNDDCLYASKMATNSSTSQQASGTDGSFQGQRPLTEFSFPKFGRRDRDREQLIRLGANMPARAMRVSHGSNSDRFPSSQSDNICKVVLYFGIIDILRDYNFTKKIEHAYKSLQVDPSSISAVDPKLYSKRFLDFITTVFVKDD